MKYLAICPKCEKFDEICEDDFRSDWYCLHEPKKYNMNVANSTDFLMPEQIHCKIVVVLT